jgi:hypothetical protein
VGTRPCHCMYPMGMDAGMRSLSMHGCKYGHTDTAIYVRTDAQARASMHRCGRRHAHRCVGVGIGALMQLLMCTQAHGCGHQCMDAALLQLPAVFAPTTSVTDMAVHGNRLASVTLDGRMATIMTHGLALLCEDEGLEGV